MRKKKMLKPRTKKPRLLIAWARINGEYRIKAGFLGAIQAELLKN